MSGVWLRSAVRLPMTESLETQLDFYLIASLPAVVTHAQDPPPGRFCYSTGLLCCAKDKLQLHQTQPSCVGLAAVAKRLCLQLVQAWQHEC